MKRAALLAVDGGGSKIDVAFLRRDGTVLGAARVAGEFATAPGRLGPSRGSSRGARRIDRPPSAPGSIRTAAPVADVGIFCLAGADLPADDRRPWPGRGRTAGRANRSCATTRSRCCARGPTARGASRSSAVSARTAPASRPTGASRGSPRSGDLRRLGRRQRARGARGVARDPLAGRPRAEDLVPAVGSRPLRDPHARAADGGALLRQLREERFAELAPLVFGEATAGDPVAL